MCQIHHHLLTVAYKLPCIPSDIIWPSDFTVQCVLLSACQIILFSSVSAKKDIFHIGNRLCLCLSFKYPYQFYLFLIFLLQLIYNALSFLDILIDCHHPFFGGQKEGQEQDSKCFILCLIWFCIWKFWEFTVKLKLLTLYFHSKIKFSKWISEKEFLKDRNECY